MNQKYKEFILMRLSSHLFYIYMHDVIIFHIADPVCIYDIFP